jgi:hypothetical protein
LGGCGQSSSTDLDRSSASANWQIASQAPGHPWDRRNDVFARRRGALQEDRFFLRLLPPVQSAQMMAISTMKLIRWRMVPTGHGSTLVHAVLSAGQWARRPRLQPRNRSRHRDQLTMRLESSTHRGAAFELSL